MRPFVLYITLRPSPYAQTLCRQKVTKVSRRKRLPRRDSDSGHLNGHAPVQKAIVHTDNDLIMIHFAKRSLIAIL